MASTRRLAGILAADVAGYSRLMGADEGGTHERLKVHFRQVTDPKIEEHRGRVVKNTGDGVLVEFPSVVDAVRCAAEVQRGMIDREPMVADERRIRFRIGINLGDIIAEGGDIFLVTASMSRRAWKRSPSPAGSAFPERCTTRSATSCPTRSTTWVSRASRTPRPVRVYALRPEAVADSGPVQGLHRVARGVVAPLGASHPPQPARSLHWQ
jgi:adenylate cyclase